MINRLVLPFCPSFQRTWSQPPAAAEIEPPAPALSRPTEPARQLQARQLHQAFQHAYQRFAQAYPAWVKHGFSDEWLRPALLQPLLRQGGGCADSAYFLLPTAHELVERWNKCCDKQGGGAEPVAQRVQRQVELIGVADDLLLWLQDELLRDDPQEAIPTE
ncbi:MAG: hypothetical protein DYG89_13900 [Caldilinea sp. CFX5]|nr:hypothetical protein [Caldilinea sp. CFX5]